AAAGAAAGAGARLRHRRDRAGHRGVAGGDRGVSQPPGLAVERTVLAWLRTWLAVGACALLLFRMSIGSTAQVAAALALGAVALLLLTLVGRRRAAHLRAI